MEVGSRDEHFCVWLLPFRLPGSGRMRSRVLREGIPWDGRTAIQAFVHPLVQIPQTSPRAPNLCCLPQPTIPQDHGAPEPFADFN